MKNKSIIFAVFMSGTNFLTYVCVAFLFATNTALYAANNRLSISNGCYTARLVIVPDRTEKDSLSSFNYFNFSFMSGTMKNASTAKYSNRTSTLFHETELQLKQAPTLPEISKVLIGLVRKINDKVELNIHFIIQGGDNNSLVAINQMNGNHSLIAGRDALLHK